MNKQRTKIFAVALACGAIGAAAGIAGGVAAPAQKAAHAHARAAHAQGDRIGGLPPFGPGGMEVHEEAVVLNKAGNGFITVTADNGSVQTVSGDQLTIKEGVGSVTYKTVTLTIGANAAVTRNFKTASLSDLQSGDHVHVASSSEGTTVHADDGSVRPPHIAPGMLPPPGPHPGAGYGPPGGQGY